MKTLKTLTTALLVILSASAFASDETSNNKLQMDYTIKAYIDAVSNGKVKGVGEIFDTEVKATETRGERIVNFSKSEIIASLKVNENIVQNCSTSYSLVDLSSTQAVVKVVMTYEGFSLVKYLNVSNTSKGWKITNISTTFS